jgi:hypothetical protein
MAEGEKGEGKTSPAAAPESVVRRLACPKCGKVLNPAEHGSLVFDGQVWCDHCHAYARELIWPREIREIEAWSSLICGTFGFPPVQIEMDLDPAVFRRESSVLMAEADHRHRSIRFYPPGCRLSTLCHELAHIYTGQDHTHEWAEIFADIISWVKSRLEKGEGPPGCSTLVPTYSILKRVY